MAYKSRQRNRTRVCLVENLNFRQKHLVPRLLLLLIVRFLHEKDVAQGILDGSVRRRRTGRDAHHHLLVHVKEERFGNDLTRHGPMSDGVVRLDAIGLVDVEGSDPRVGRDFEQMGGVAGIPSADDQDEIQTVLLRVVNQLVDRILAFLLQQIGL